LGALTSLTYPSGRNVTYGYNSAGQLDQLQFASWNGSVPSGGAYTYWSVADNNFYASGVPKSGGLGNGLTETLQFNSRLQPSEESVTGLANVIFADHTYGFGSQNNGNVLNVTDRLNTSRTQTFTYDSLNRLATGAESRWGLSFVYDAWGNRLQ